MDKFWLIVLFFIVVGVGAVCTFAEVRSFIWLAGGALKDIIRSKLKPKA